MIQFNNLLDFLEFTTDMAIEVHCRHCPPLLEIHSPIDKPLNLN